MRRSPVAAQRLLDAQIMRLIASALTLSSLTACTGPDNPFSDPAFLGLNVTIQPNGDTSTVASVWVQPRDSVTGCVDSSLAGTFGGAPLVVQSLGCDCGSDICGLPTLVATERATTGLVEVHDASGAISATFPVDELQPSTATAASWDLSGGSTVAIDWSPVADLATRRPVAWLGLFSPSTPFAIQVVGNQLSMQVPAQLTTDAALDGSTLYIELAASGDGAQLIDGAGCTGWTCELENDHAFGHAITLGP
jgi:hypothetical protein